MLTQHIISQIYTNFSYTPTLDQKNLINSLAEFIYDSKSGEIMIINGYAGTGKTTVIAAIHKTLNQFKIPCFMLAPTGRAAKVMAGYAKASALTIHKKIYKQKSALVDSFQLDKNLTKNGFFIIDEASMLSDSSYDSSFFGSGNLLADLVKYVNSGENCKLILVGDKAQLPPVYFDESPALDRYTMEQYGSVTYCELKNIIRQKEGSGILHNATLLREMINNNITDIPKFDTSFKDVKAINGTEFIDELESCYSKYGVDETIVITRSNKQANRFNGGVRGRVLFQEEELSSGDMVMIVKNNYFHTPEDGGVGFLANGDLAKIKRLRRYEELFGFRFVNATITLPDYDNTELECKVILDTLDSDTPSLSSEASKRLFDEVEKDYSHIPRKADRYKAMREDEYFNALQIKFAYAVTCHKAQGGQWDAVFIDKMLFGDEQMSKDFQRWLYTAITRAKKRLYFINFDERFF